MPAESASKSDVPAEVANAFREAIRLAATFRGATSPNPPVGCVILDREGAIVAAAAHERAGRAHAEAAALATCTEYGSYDRIQTVIVTLEPCNHWGRTPPCSQAILDSPARTVWFGVSDPNPVAGGGAVRLAAAGREAIELGGCSGPLAASLAAECRSLVAPFSKRTLSGRPWVTVKQALDPGGSMVPPPGRKTFTSPPALIVAHRMRKRADAVMTGSGTILADRPEFTVRHVADHPHKRRLLAVLDRRGRVPSSYIEEATARGFDVLLEENLDAALERLGQRGALEVLVEAGPRLTESVLDAGLWDEHVVIRRGVGDDPDTCETRLRESGTSRLVEIAPLHHHGVPG